MDNIDKSAPDTVLTLPADISASELRDAVIAALPEGRLRDLFVEASEHHLRASFAFGIIASLAARAGVAAVPGPARPGAKL